jgi:hypothetical protein
MSPKLKLYAGLSTAVFAFFTIWWMLLYTHHSPRHFTADNFSDTYGILAAVGGIGGIAIAKRWGGFKSLMGKSVMFFSIGLLFQALGQSVYSLYFFFLHQDIPYPSLGDIGYFGSVLLYIYATYCLGRVAGANFSLRRFGNKILAVIIPAALLIVSYYVFLRGYSYTQPLTAFLDFGYPFGEAIYISLAILILILSRKILGGIMRWRILLLLLALATQYAADFLFLLRDTRGEWYAGGPSDFLYLVAYYVMILALLSIGVAYQKIGVEGGQ